MEYEARQAVFFPVENFLELELHLLETRPGLKPEAFINDLVKRWLARDIERGALRTKGSAMQGFQWKTLFLPEGTLLRTTRCGEVEFAKVSGNHILSGDGAVLTPSLFANGCSTGRNAWRFVWLRFPGDDYWVRADQCRERSGIRGENGLDGRRSLSKSVDNDTA